MEFKGLTSASHMSLQEAGYGSEEGQLGSEISGAVSGVTTPGASRLQASQSQERSTTMQRLQKFLTLWDGYGLSEATWEPMSAFIQPDGSINEGQLLTRAETMSQRKKRN